MRKNAIILHGVTDKEEVFDDQYPSMSNAHWLPWMQKQLVKQGFNCQTPEMPDVWMPRYEEWHSIFSSYPVFSETVLIGHSAGGGFFLKWLGENDEPIAKLILIAPWLDPHRTRGDFLQCTLSRSLQERIGEIHVFVSDDEPVDGVKETVDLVCATYPRAQMHRFTAHGHFCLDDMETDKFPELLQAVLG